MDISKAQAYLTAQGLPADEQSITTALGDFAMEDLADNERDLKFLADQVKANVVDVKAAAIEPVKPKRQRRNQLAKVEQKSIQRTVPNQIEVSDIPETVEVNLNSIPNQISDEYNEAAKDLLESFDQTASKLAALHLNAGGIIAAMFTQKTDGVKSSLERLKELRIQSSKDLQQNIDNSNADIFAAYGLNSKEFGL